MSLTAYDHVKTEQAAFTPPAEEFGREIVPFGIYHVDANFLMGVSPTIPQLYSIQGISGARKTTLAFNLIIRMCISGCLPQGHKIIYDILESGQSIEKCLLILRCQVAALYMIYRHATRFRGIEPDEPILPYLNCLFNQDILGKPDEIVESLVTRYNGTEVPECVLKPSFIRRFYLNRIHMTPRQTEAWILAGDALREFPIEFYGLSAHANREERKRRTTITDNIEESVRRWAKITTEYDSVQFFSDHLNAYNTPGKDYDKQIFVMPFIDHFIKEYQVTFWLLFQEGVTNRREYDSKGEVLGGKGGDTVKAISDTNWRVSYDKNRTPFYMELSSPVKSREGDHPDLQLMIEPNSGAIFGKSKIKTR